MAGADRVEGTLFGNGERTGNADILTIGMNMFTQGVDPELDFTHMNDIVSIYEDSTQMNVHPRHPYAGELVFTAFLVLIKMLSKRYDSNENTPRTLGSAIFAS